MTAVAVPTDAEKVIYLRLRLNPAESAYVTDDGLKIYQISQGQLHVFDGPTDISVMTDLTSLNDWLSGFQPTISTT